MDRRTIRIIRCISATHRIANPQEAHAHRHHRRRTSYPQPYSKPVYRGEQCAQLSIEKNQIATDTRERYTQTYSRSAIPRDKPVDRYQSTRSHTWAGRYRGEGTPGSSMTQQNKVPQGAEEYQRLQAAREYPDTYSNHIPPQYTLNTHNPIPNH